MLAGAARLTTEDAGLHATTLALRRAGFFAPFTPEQMRVSSAQAASSWGSCGTSSPRKGLGEERLRKLVHVRPRFDEAVFKLVGKGEQLLYAADNFILLGKRWYRDGQGL